MKKDFLECSRKEHYKIVRGVQLRKENKRGDNMPVKAGPPPPPFEAILVIFGRRALIFFV